MVHMPAHIYQRWVATPDAVRSNDSRSPLMKITFRSVRAQGLYPMAYYPHNLHFLWFAAPAEVAARWRSKRRARLLRELTMNFEDVPLLAGFRRRSYYALTRFRKVGRDVRET